MAKVLVTGGAGFIGSHVVDELIRNNNEVIIIDNISSGSKDNLNPKAKFYETDIGNAERLEAVFSKEKPEYVFHLAAQINVRESIKNPANDASINIIGGLNVIEACRKFKVKKIIFSSTGGAIYGDGVKIPTDENEEKNPASPYGIAKLTIEKYLQFYKKVYGLDFVVLRYANVYGPRQNAKGEAGVIAIFIGRLLNKEKPTIFGDGEQTRDYIYVGDVAKANVLALNLSGIFNVGTGEETSVNQLVEMIAKKLGVKNEAIHNESIRGELLRSCLDAGKLKGKGWKLEYNLEKGLRETIAYFESKR